MAERTDVRSGSGGFTLIELLAATFLLMLGFSSLVGLMGVGVSTRRTAELRDQAVFAADQVLEQARAAWFDAPEEAAADRNGEPAPLPILQLDTIAGYPLLRATVTPVVDPDVPWLVLAVIRVSWFEEGQLVGEEFRRVLEAYESYPSRIARSRSER